MEIILVTWFALSLVASSIAVNKGRSGVGFFLLSIILSPLIGLLAALAARRDEGALDRERIRTGEARACPHCAEAVKLEAKVCKHCGRDPPEHVPLDTPLHQAGRALDGMFRK